MNLCMIQRVADHEVRLALTSTGGQKSKFSDTVRKKHLGKLTSYKPWLFKCEPKHFVSERLLEDSFMARPWLSSWKQLASGSFD